MFCSDSKEDFLREQAYTFQCKRYEVFKSQDLEKGHFDVTFEAEGRKLYAHKFTITSVSETIEAMLSNRWLTNKDEDIKVENYSYDNFYEFICFIYSGDCKLNDDNIFIMVDMAEFYGVAFLKSFCDKHLSMMKKSIETVEEMAEFAQKYALPKFQRSLEMFIYAKFDDLIKAETFVYHKKSFLELISRNKPYMYSEENYFQAVCKWAKHQALQRATKTVGGNLDIVEAIKSEINTIIPSIKLYKMDYNFLLNFVVENSFLLSPTELYKCFTTIKEKYHPFNEEHCFTSVYKLAEKQALQRQKNSPNQSLVDSIKADLAEIIPCVKFYRMNYQFFIDFVVEKRILTEEDANRIYDTRVEIKCDLGFFTGVFKDYFGIRRKAENINGYGWGDTVLQKCTIACFRNLKFHRPPTSSTVKKMKGVQWYLCLDKDGAVTLKHHTKIQRIDYLITEMKSNTDVHLNNIKVMYIKFYHNA